MSGFFAVGILAAKKKNIAAEQIACIFQIISFIMEFNPRQKSTLAHNIEL